MNLRRKPVLLIAMSIAALIWVVVARVTGPSDLWDHTQPRTVSYTTDIIINGGLHWILPIERGTLPATKPPLYNWLAVPAVRWLGFNSEIAHRLPSIVSLCLCWLIVVRLGRAIDPAADQSLGWLAGLILVANTTIFKLGYLARPDMLLTLWLLLAWALATHVIIERDSPRTLRSGLCIAGYWTCIALAGLTKGPAALVGILYALIAPRVIAGRWSDVRLLKPWIGFPLSLTIIGLWVYGVWQINPEHLYHRLWHDEVWGRITGTGPEGNRHGPSGLIIDFPLQALYFVLRFLPWSLCAIAVAASMRRSMRQRSNDAAPLLDRPTQWMFGAAVQVVVVVGLYTLSAGKRADYLAAALPPGALLAAWWLLRMKPMWAVRWPWLAPAAATLVLSGVTLMNRLEPSAEVVGYGDSIRRFIDQASERIAREPLPVVFCWSGDSQLQAMLGASTPDSTATVLEKVERRERFWVVAGRKGSEPADFGDWLDANRRGRAAAEPVVRSEVLPRPQGWPEQVTLFRVHPVGNPPRKSRRP